MTTDTNNRAKQLLLGLQLGASNACARGVMMDPMVVRQQISEALRALGEPAELTVSEAVDYIREEYGIVIRRNSLYQAVRRGSLYGVQNGSRWTVSVEEVDRYARERLGRPGRPRSPKKGKAEEIQNGRSADPRPKPPKPTTGEGQAP